MSKEKFIKWNNLKILIHEKAWVKYANERDIWFTHIWKNIWVEQNWKWDEFLRPVVILKKLNKDAFVIIPLTKSNKKWSFFYNFRFVDKIISTAVLAQIKVIDRKRLDYKIGKIEKWDFSKLKNKLRKLLSL